MVAPKGNDAIMRVMRRLDTLNALLNGIDSRLVAMQTRTNYIEEAVRRTVMAEDASRKL